MVKENELIHRNFLFRIQMIKSANITDEQIIPNQGNSITSSFSFSSSLTQTHDDEDTELFPQLNSSKPRLAMQISRQIQY